MIRHRAASTLVAIILVAALSGCGGPRNREAVTFTQDDVAAAQWASDGYDAWRQQVDLDDALPTFSDLGAYPMGNGRVFGIAGLSLPLGTVQDILGPTYQKTGGLLGAWVPAVLVDGEPVTIARQSMRWIAPGGVVHSRWEGEELHVDLLQTVPPEVDAIVTLMMVTNAGDTPLDVSLGLQSSLPIDGVEGGDLLCSRGDIAVRGGFAGAETSLVDRAVLPEFPADLPDRVRPLTKLAAEMDAESLLCPLGEVVPDESVGKVSYIAIGGADETASIVQTIEQEGWQLFEDAHAWWQDWHDRTLIVEGAGDEIDQFMAIQKYLCRVQQAEAGGYSPMHKYTYRWIRDSNGPIMFLLDCGDFASVDRDLSYHFAGCALNKEIFNNMPLTLDPSKAEPIDWSEIPTPKAEIASFVILQNWWYYQHTGETEQLEERWDYLMAAFEGHDVDAQGRLPFHGDETYRFPGYQLFTAEPEAVSDYVHLTLRSADSAFEYVAAAEAMAEMGRRIGRPEAEIEGYLETAVFVREATERLYWQHDRGYYAPAMSAVSGELYRYPFANINMRATWIGYAEGDARQQRNVTSALSHLYRPDAGTSNLTPTCGYTVGMTPGMVLSALTFIDHPEAAKALDGVLVAASPSGGFAEMNRPDDTPARDVWGMHRVRPWEGGINGSAVLQYLTGFEPDAEARSVSFTPRLPDGADSMTVRNLRVGAANLTLEVIPRESDLGDVLCRVTCEEADAPISVNIQPPQGDGPIRLHNPPYQSIETGESVERWGQSGRRDIPFEVADEPFDYGPADVPQDATVLLTWSGEVADQVRAAEGEITVIDSRIAWPTGYLRSALLNEDGSPRAGRLITDIEGFAGAFKKGDYWTEGEGAALLEEYEAAGGVTNRTSAPAAGGAPTESLIN